MGSIANKKVLSAGEAQSQISGSRVKFWQNDLDNMDWLDSKKEVDAAATRLKNSIQADDELSSSDKELLLKRLKRIQSRNR